MKNMKTIEKETFFNLIVENCKVILCLLFICCSVTLVKGQEDVKPVIQQRSQKELKAIQALFSTPSTMMMKGAPSAMQKSSLQSSVEKSNKFEGMSKDQAVMEILIIKNQVFEIKEMPESRKRLNIKSFLDDFEIVLSDEEFLKLKNNMKLLKQLDLFINEKLDNQ